MSLRDDILDLAKLELYSCLYKGEDRDWDRGFEQGVDYAIQFIKENGWADPRDIIDVMDGHYMVRDEIPRCSCGAGYATMVDLGYHIAEMISMCNCGSDDGVVIEEIEEDE